MNPAIVANAKIWRQLRGCAIHVPVHSLLHVAETIADFSANHPQASALEVSTLTNDFQTTNLSHLPDLSSRVLYDTQQCNKRT